MKHRYRPEHMVKNKSFFARMGAGLLALLIVAGAVFCLDFPAMSANAEAKGIEDADTSAYYVNNRFRKDGVYMIRSFADSSKVLTVEGDSVDAGAFVEVATDAGKDSQHFVLQINERQNGETSTGTGVYNPAGGYDNDSNEDTAVYGIRVINSTFWVHANIGASADGAVSQRRSAGASATSYPNYRAADGLWKFIHNDDGTFYIVMNSTGQYLYTESTANGTNVKVSSGTKPQGDNYKWNLEQKHLPNTFIKEGTYFIESHSNTPYGGTVSPLELIKNYVCGINANNVLIANELINESTGVNKVTNTYMHFKLQKVSGGFYTITNLATGKYVACVDNLDSEHPTGKEIRLVSGQDSGSYPNVNERWILAPVSSRGIDAIGKVTVDGVTYTGSTDRFRIISAYNGHQLTNTKEKFDANGTPLTLGLQRMINDESQTWCFKSIYKHPENNQKGKTLSGDTGVYADTFDVNDTVTLPIKIYDYAADGMLFEYASNTSDAQFLTYDGKTYRMGSNNGFTMQSRSSGGRGLGESSEWHAGNYPDGSMWASLLGDGSASFDYNKYWAPYVSGLKFTNTNGNITWEYNNPQLDLNSPTGGYQAGGHTVTSNPAFAAAAGGMNVSTSGIDYSTIERVRESLSFPLYSTQTFGTATLGLTESDLREIELDVTNDGIDNPQLYKLPQYREQTVEYIALVLQRALGIQYTSEKSYEDKSTVYNYNYVAGEPTFANNSGLDLATLFRGDTKADPFTTDGVLEIAESYGNPRFRKYGSYAETLAKANNPETPLIGTWDQVSGNIDTCMDAAYWMLNSIFLEGSFNQPQTTFTSLVLTKVTDTDGREGYIFDSTFVDNSSSNTGVANSAVEYDAQAGTIRNTSAAGKSFTYHSSTENSYTSSYPFLPVRDAQGNQRQTMTAYPMDEGVNSPSMSTDGDPEYTNRNYNFVLQSNASFIYHADDQLYFQFEGDDDVYLFINNELVVDIGGAHSVVGSKMYLNDYVEWAWEVMSNPSAYTAKEVERAEKLALVEGNSYSFDFYYMERHGYGSNMRIFTNFQLTDTNLHTEKSAYQNGSKLPYGGVVDGSSPVEYGFSTKNNGNSNLYSLSFEDKDIGVSVDWNNGLVVNAGATVTDSNGETLDPADLEINLTSPEGQQYGVALTSQEELKTLLSSLAADSIAEVSEGNGLLPGWSIEIRGIYCTLTKEQKDAGIFTNIVNVKAYTEEGNSDGTTNGTELHAIADAQIRVHSKPLYYEWSAHELKVTLAEFIGDVTEATNENGEYLYPVQEVLNLDTFKDMYLCGPTGIKMMYDYVTLDSTDYTLYFNYPAPGGYYVSIKIVYTQDGEDRSLIVPFSVFVTDVEDKVFVLDYGLGAELTADNALTENDTLTANGRNTTYAFMGITEEAPSYADNNISFAPDADGVIDRGKGADDLDNKGYGKYTYSETDETLRYDPSEFMEGADTVWAAYRVSENMDTAQPLGQVDINEEVEMYKSVTVIPANVVYYEDTFDAIDYDSAGVENTIEIIGTLEDAVSNDQGVSSDTNYGYDDGAYAADTNVQLSHGTCTKVTILDADNDPWTYDVAASFKFKGTGFELISRTNAKDSASIMIQLHYPNGMVNYIPVITEFDHGADGGDEVIYQVPVVRIEGLEYGEYTVEIVGVPAYEWEGSVMGDQITTYLYVDGVRIYNPIKGSDYEDNYGDEKGALFTEMRNLVLNGMGIAVQYEPGESIALTYADIYVSEDRNKDDEYTTSKGGLSQLNIVGPNNELYINGTDENYAVVLNVKETGDGPHLLQIGVHDVDEEAFAGNVNGPNKPSAIRIGYEEKGTYCWSDTINILSGTEQYITVDYSKCPVVDGYYQVVIDVEGFVSFTNVKYNNLEFKKFHAFEAGSVFTYMEESLAIFDKNGNPIPVQNTDYPDVNVLNKQLASK